MRYTKRNEFDYCVITAYFPVSGQDMQGTQRLVAWMDEVLSQLPLSCIPLLGMDANGKVCLVRVDDCLVQPSPEEGVGEHRAEIENQKGRLLREVLCKRQLRAANTWHERASGATFWSHEDRGSRIDYLCAPRTLHQLFVVAKQRASSATKQQCQA